MNIPLPPAAATRVRYGVLGWFCSLSMITYIDRVCIMQVQDDIQRDLGIPAERFWIVFSAFALAYAAFEIPSGWLGDRFGPRKVLTRIVLCWLAFTALTGAVWSLASLVVVRALFGAGEAGAYPNIARGAKSWFPFAERGRAQGMIWSFGRWGGAIAPQLIIALAHPFERFDIMHGWRGAFLMLCVLGVFWVIGFHRFFRDSPAEHPRVNDAEKALIDGPVYRDQRQEMLKEWPAADAAPPPEAVAAASDVVGVQGTNDVSAPAKSSAPALDAPPPLSWGALLSSRTLWCLSIMYFCSNSGWSFFITYVTPYLKNDLQLHGWQLHLAAGAPLFFGGFGCMLGGLLTDYLVPVLGRRWGRTGQGLVAYALGGGFFLTAVALTQSHPVWAFTALCVASFLKDLAMGASWSTTIDIGHRYSGTVAGVMNTVGNLGTVVSPLLVTTLVTLATVVEPGATGGAAKWAVSLYYYAAMFFVAAFCWLFINPRRVIVYAPADRERLQTAGVLA